MFVISEEDSIWHRRAGHWHETNVCSKSHEGTLCCRIPTTMYFVKFQIFKIIFLKIIKSTTTTTKMYVVRLLNVGCTSVTTLFPNIFGTEHGSVAGTFRLSAQPTSLQGLYTNIHKLVHDLDQANCNPMLSMPALFIHWRPVCKEYFLVSVGLAHEWSKHVMPLNSN